MLQNLPDKPEIAHALIQQKLNEHTEELRAVKKENEKQNQQLKKIEDKIDRVERNTDSLVNLFQAGEGTVKTFKWIGKLVVWIGGIAGAVTAIWAFITSWPNQGG